MTVLAPLAAAAGWLLALAGVAEVTDRVPRLARLAQGAPAYGLALGVYATTFTVFGGVGFASRYGLAYLAFYVGVAVSGLAVPVLWGPLGVLVRELRWSSPADALAYRFASARVGALVTVFLVAGLLPYLSLQVHALSEAAEVLAGPAAPGWLGLGWAAVLYLFAAGVGVRYAEPWARRPGLVATLAVETVAKGVGVWLVAGAAVALELGGPRGVAE
ncbi:MAG: histidine kinase, partial [Myxococcota bacterium]